MTKFMEWLAVIGSVFCVWAALVTYKIDNNFTRQYYTCILYFPIYAVVLVGLYAITVVLYKTFTFNDCRDASVMLQKEIIAAKEDLARLGFQFKIKQ